MIDGRTHWEDCWTEHRDCLQQRLAEKDRARAAAIQALEDRQREYLEVLQHDALRRLRERLTEDGAAVIEPPEWETPQPDDPIEVEVSGRRFLIEVSVREKHGGHTPGPDEGFCTKCGVRPRNFDTVCMPQ